MNDRLALLLATWFGCGYSKFGPGTVGSLGALAIAYVLHSALGWNSYHIGAMGVLLIAPGIWASGIAADQAGRKDPGLVVVDEVAGQWITMMGATILNWKAWLIGFLLFRILDIVKPPPARQFESLPGGLGIMADDVMAGIYGAILLYYIGYFGLY